MSIHIGTLIKLKSNSKDSKAGGWAPRLGNATGRDGSLVSHSVTLSLLVVSQISLPGLAVRRRKRRLYVHMISKSV